MTLAHPGDADVTGRGAFFHRHPDSLSIQALLLLAYRAGRYSMTAFSDVIRYSSSALSTAVNTGLMVAEAAKTLSGPVAPPLPSIVHGEVTYFPISSLRREKYEVVFLLECGHEVTGFKLTPTQPQRAQGVVDCYTFEHAGYLVRNEVGVIAELPRSAWPVAWRPQAYAESKGVSKAMGDDQPAPPAGSQSCGIRSPERIRSPEK